jgi:hypothetical protein
MANISENSVFTAMDSYEKGVCVRSQIFEWSQVVPFVGSAVAFHKLGKFTVTYSVKKTQQNEEDNFYLK